MLTNQILLSILRYGMQDFYWCSFRVAD